MSPALKNVLLTTLSWVCVLAWGISCYVYYPELKGYTASLLGLPSPQRLAAATQAAGRDEDAEAVSRQGSRSGSVELHAGQNGHFATSASVNGRSIEVMVDTGASIVALTAQDADRAGIFVRPSDFTGRVNTANGVARVAPVTIDSITIGDITVRNVKAVVSEEGNLGVTLLGMSFLSKLSRAEMRHGSLVLEE